MRSPYLAPVLSLFITFCFVGCSKSPEEVQLEKEIGQMIMVGFQGTSLEASDHIKEDITKYHIGGVILFDKGSMSSINEDDESTAYRRRNIESPEQLKALTESLQAKAEIPLFIAIDQEGGQVARLKPESGFDETVSHAFLGAQMNANRTYREGKRIAGMLKKTGINVNLAPCVDLALNPKNPVIAKRDRSFGKDPEYVGIHALAFIRAHHKMGILCAPKHFPGHGSSRGDTHKGFTDVSNVWEAEELEPFQALIDEDAADMIMAAHIFNEYLDPNYPATLSHSILTKMLRENMGYTGVIIADDMNMRAIADNFGKAEAIKQAILAGVDIILIANTISYDEDAAKETLETIKNFVEEEAIPRERITESYDRIQKLKAGLIKDRA